MYKCGIPIGPDEFNEKEREIARNHGVLIQQRALEWASEVWVNCCPHCPAIVGPSFVYGQYMTKALMGEFPSQVINIGYYCYACTEKAWEERPDDIYM